MWFYLFMTLGSLLFIFATVYKWKWIRKGERGFFLPSLRWRTARLLYLFVGTGGLSVAIAGLGSIILSTNSPLLFIPSLLIACVITTVLFKHQNKQSIIEFLRSGE